MLFPVLDLNPRGLGFLFPALDLDPRGLGRCRWGTLWAPHRPYYREVGLGNKAYSPIAKKNAKQSNVQNRNSNSNYTRKGARSVA